MADYTSLTDTELITLLHQGEHNAFKHVYERYYALLFFHAYKKLQDTDQAKDLVQDTFVTLWTKRLQIIPGANLPGYLIISLRNRIFDCLSHTKVAGRYLDSLQHFLDSGVAETDHRVRRNQLWSIIQSEIDELPPRMREIFRLSRISGLSHKEIAQSLELSEETVKVQVKSALRILRKKLGITRFVYFLLFF